MPPEKHQIINRLQSEHEELKKIIAGIPPENLAGILIFDNWSVREILAHISAWNGECVNEIERVLKNQAFWPGHYESEEGESAFNEKAIGERKSKSADEVINEWEGTFQKIIGVVEQLTESEWNHQSDHDTWSNDQPVTVASLFDYDYAGRGHEGGHTEQIKKVLHR